MKKRDKYIHCIDTLPIGPCDGTEKLKKEKDKICYLDEEFGEVNDCIIQPRTKELVEVYSIIRTIGCNKLFQSNFLPRYKYLAECQIAYFLEHRSDLCSKTGYTIFFSIRNRENCIIWSNPYDKKGKIIYFEEFTGNSKLILVKGLDHRVVVPSAQMPLA